MDDLKLNGGGDNNGGMMSHHHGGGGGDDEDNNVVGGADGGGDGQQQQQDDSGGDVSSGGGGGGVPEIELIIKASTIDGRRKGACLFCQEYFMDLYLLAELKTISLKVTTVDMQKPPPDFRSNFEATPPPILIDGGLAVLENEKIERHIMKNIPGGHNLFVQDKEVATLIENVYSKFKLMLMKKDDGGIRNLLMHLKKIDDHLGVKRTRFLTGDTLCCFDCELMPRLQHIRVAGSFFVTGFAISPTFRNLWGYMENMYNLDAFTQSCPADQDIINHYKLQQGVKMKKHEELETPTYTTSIPPAGGGQGEGE